MATLFFNIEADYTKVTQLRNELQRLQTQMARFNATTPVSQIRALEAQMASCRAQMNGMLVPAAQLGSQFQHELTSGLHTASRGFNELKTSGNGVQNMFTGISGGLSSFIKQFSAAALTVKGLNAVLGILQQSMSTITSFEASNSVLQAVSGATNEQLDAMRDKALELGRATRYTASQVTELEIALSKLGFNPDDINAMSQSILQFGLATGASLDDAATITGAALRMFGADATEATRYTSAMSAAINKTALNFQAVSDNLATFGPVAHTIGLEIEQSLAIFGKLKDLGYEGSTAATSVRNILNEMSSGKLSKALGYEVKSFDDFIKALKDLNNMGYATGTGPAMKAVGKRGGAQLIALIQNAQAVEDKYREIASMSVSSEGMDNLAETMNNNVAGAIFRVQSAWEDLILNMSNATGPVATVIDSVSQGINSLSDAIKGNGEGKTVFGMDAETVLNVTKALGALMATVATYKVLVMPAKEAMDSFRASMASVVSRQQMVQYEKMAFALKQVTEARMAENGAKTVELEKDMKLLVNKGLLTKEQATEIQALRTKALARKEEIANELKKLQVEQTVAVQMERNARGELEAAKRARDLAFAKNSSATAVQREAAQLKYDTAQLNYNAAASMKNANSTQIAALTEEELALSSAASTAAFKGQSVASMQLSAALDALGLSALANPYVLLAAALVALGYVIYESVTATDSYTQAQNHLNSAIEEYREGVKTTESKAREYISTMESGTATAYQQVEAYKELIKLYKQFGNYSAEEILAMKEEDRARIMAQASQDGEIEMYRKRKAALEALKAEMKGANEVSLGNLWMRLDNQSMYGHTITDFVDNVYDTIFGTESGVEAKLKRIGEEYGVDISEIFSNASEFQSYARLVEDELDVVEKKIKSVTGEIGSVDVSQTLIAAMGVSPKSIKDFKEFQEILEMIREYGSKGWIGTGTDDSNKFIERMIEMRNNLEEQFNETNRMIVKESDNTRKETLHKQAGDIMTAIQFFDTYLQALSESSENAANGVNDAMSRIKMSSDMQIEIGDSYRNAVGAIDDLAKSYNKLSKEEKARGETGQVNAKDTAKVVNDEINKTEKKIAELKKRLEDPELSDAEKQQIKVDLEGAEKALKDLRGLLDMIQTAIDKKDFKVVIDFITRYSEERNPNKKTAKTKGTKEFTRKDGTKGTIDYTSVVTETVTRGNEKWLYTTYIAEDGSKYTYMQPVKKSTDKASVISENANKAIQQGDAATNKKAGSDSGVNNTDDDPKKALKEAKKQDRIEEQLHQNRIKREREAQDVKAKLQKDKIDMMEDGVEKSLALADHEYNETLRKLKRAEEDKREERYKTAKAAWEAKNDGAFKGDRNSVEYALTQEEKAEEKMQEALAAKKRDEAVRTATKVYDTILERNLKYEKYERDILAMEKQIQAARENGDKEAIIAWQKKIQYAKILRDKTKDYSMDEFLSKYGVSDERLTALDNIYQRKVDEILADSSKGNGDMLTAYQEWLDARAKVEFDALKQSINWEAVFGDMDAIAMSELKDLKGKLRQALGQDLNVEQYKAISEAIEKINNQMSERKDTWSSMFRNAVPYFAKLREAKENAKDANKLYQDAQERLTSLRLKKTTKELELQSRFAMNGVKGKISADTSKNEFEDMLLNVDNEEERTQLRNIYQALVSIGLQVGAQVKITKDAENNANSENSKAQRLSKNFTEALGGVSEVFDIVNGNVQAMPEFMQNIGMDADSSMVKGMTEFTKSSASATQAFKDFMSLNFVGAANDVIGTFSSLGNALGEWGIAGFGSTDSTLARDMERLEASNRELAKAVEALTDEMMKSSVSDATSTYDKAKSDIEKQVANTREEMIRSLNVASKGFLGVGSKASSRAKVNDAVNSTEWARVSSILGKSVTNATDFFNLTSEQMAKVAAHATDIWTKIKNAADDGAGNASQFMDTYIEYYKQLEDLADKYQEKVTTVTFDDLRNDFKNALDDMSSDVDDFTDNFENLMRKAIVNSLLDDTFEERLKAWQGKFTEAMQDGSLSKSEKDALQAEYKQMAQEYIDRRNELYDAVGLDSASSQSASAKGVNGMSEDTGNEMNGRMTAIQIAVEGIRALEEVTLNQINNQMLVAAAQRSSMVTIADESRDYIIRSYIELQEINENTADMRKTLRDVCDAIVKVKNNTNNL